MVLIIQRSFRLLFSNFVKLESVGVWGLWCQGINKCSELCFNPFLQGNDHTHLSTGQPPLACLSIASIRVFIRFNLPFWDPSEILSLRWVPHPWIQSVWNGRAIGQPGLSPLGFLLELEVNVSPGLPSMPQNVWNCHLRTFTADRKNNK